MMIWLERFVSERVIITKVLTVRIAGSFLNVGEPDGSKPVKPSFTERPVIRQDESGSITFEVRLASEPEAVVTWYAICKNKLNLHFYVEETSCPVAKTATFFVSTGFTKGRRCRAVDLNPLWPGSLPRMCSTCPDSPFPVRSPATTVNTKQWPKMSTGRQLPLSTWISKGVENWSTGWENSKDYFVSCTFLSIKQYLILD